MSSGNLSLSSAVKNSFNIRKNYIINGDFDIWQRGISQSSSGYLADRWFDDLISDTSHTVTRQQFVFGQTDVPDSPKYYSRTVVSAGTTTGSKSSKLTKIEGVRTLSGQKITLSFYAKSDSSRNISVLFTQVFGTSGSTDVYFGVQKVSISTSWQKFEVTVSVPSISGKTIGSANDDYLQVEIFFDAGSDFNSRTDTLGHQSGTFDLSHIQLERGTSSTDFNKRSYDDELALCQRYYYQTYPLGYFPGDSAIYDGSVGDKMQDTTSRTTGVIEHVWKVKMRTTPTITMYSPYNGAEPRCCNMGAAWSYTENLTFDIYNIGDIKVTGCSFDSLAANRYHATHLTADAEL